MRFWLKLGADPKRSWRRFVTGLCCFAPGAGMILWGVQHSEWWQVAGLTLLAPGFILAMWGYLGMFAHRMASALTPPARVVVDKEQR